MIFFFLQLLKPGSDSFKLPNGARSDISGVTAPLGASMCRSVTKLLPKRVGKSFFHKENILLMWKSSRFLIKLLLLQHLRLPVTAAARVTVTSCSSSSSSSLALRCNLQQSLPAFVPDNRKATENAFYCRMTRGMHKISELYSLRCSCLTGISQE